MKFGIGQSIKRREDRRFLTGFGTFVNNLNLPNQAHAYVIYSPHAHAEIKKIDASEVLNAPGVIMVLSGEDVVADGLGGLMPRMMPEDMGGPKGYRTSRPILAVGRVRHVGDRVAVIIAETLEEAVEASDLMIIEYEELPVSVNASDAIASDAYQIYEEAKNNTSFTLKMGNAEAAQAAFSKAAHVVKSSITHPRLTANSLETRACLGEYNPSMDSYTLHCGTQAPHIVRSELARFVFKISESRIRVHVPDVGGGFGMKTTPTSEEAIVLWAAKKLGRPIKWAASRSQGILSDDQGRDQTLEAELALDKSGKILALRYHALHNVGAYMVGSAVVPPIFFGRVAPSLYHIDTIDLTIKAVFTNTPPVTPYRGAGRPEAVFAIERLMDIAAKETGLDRVEIRRRNFIPSDAMPYSTQTGFVYDSGEFETIMDKCLELAEWDSFEARREASLKQGKYRGIGLSCYIEDAGNLNERMDLRFDPSGDINIISGTCSTGTGHETTYAQMISEWLGIDSERIRFIQGDTGVVPFGRGTYASRSMVVGGSALKKAADEIIEKGKKLAAHLLEAAEFDIEFKNGNFTIVGTDRSISVTDVAMASFRPMGIPIELGIGLDASGSFGVSQPSFPNGCHICEVEIDPETGIPTIVRFTVVDDVGQAINPMIVDGQIHGGIAQGVGEALYEEIVHDPKTGHLLTGSLMDYCMPRAQHFPEIHLGYHEVPCKTNPLGVKGAGEGGTVGATPAVINSILDALQPYGVTEIEMPATPMRIWQAIHEAS